LQVTSDVLPAANGFSPAPVDRGQPTVFGPGRLVGAFQTPFCGCHDACLATGKGERATAGGSSKRCTATLDLRKVTVPATDPGVFNLLVNNRVLATGGNGTTTGALSHASDAGAGSAAAARWT
jgi:hypothetical protein